MSPTDISDLDEVIGGGLPRRQLNLARGNAECGRMIIGMEFPVRRALQFGEPEAFMMLVVNAREVPTTISKHR